MAEQEPSQVTVRFRWKELDWVVTSIIEQGEIGPRIALTAFAAFDQEGHVVPFGVAHHIVDFNKETFLRRATKQVMRSKGI